MTKTIEQVYDEDPTACAHAAVNAMSRRGEHPWEFTPEAAKVWAAANSEVVLEELEELEDCEDMLRSSLTILEKLGVRLLCLGKGKFYLLRAVAALDYAGIFRVNGAEK